MAEENDKQTFTFFKGKETGDPNLMSLFNQTSDSAQEATVEDLENYFNAKENDQLRNSFGSFDNYLGYMTEREQLIQSGEYDVGNWGAAEDGSLTESQRMLLEGEDLTVDPSDPQQSVQNLESQQLQLKGNAYRNWENSEANQALLEKYGVNTKVVTDKGTTYQWNGSAYVKTAKEPNQDVLNAMKLAAVISVGGPLAGKIGTATGGGMLGGAVGNAASSALTQLAMTGDIDPKTLITNVVSGAFGEFANVDPSDMNSFERTLSNVTKNISETLGVSQEMANNLVGSVATGVAGGGNVEDMLEQVIKSYGVDVLSENIQFPEEGIEVPNIFGEGTSTISGDAINSVIGNVLKGAVTGNQDYVGILTDFAKEGGFDFLKPDGMGAIETPQWMKDFDDEVIQTILGPAKRVVGAIEDFETPQILKDFDDNVIQSVIGPIKDFETPQWMKDFDDDVLQPIKDSLLSGGGEMAPTRGGRGMMTQFNPVDASIGYTPVQLQQMILSPQRDYTRGLLS